MLTGIQIFITLSPAQQFFQSCKQPLVRKHSVEAEFSGTSETIRPHLSTPQKGKLTQTAPE